MDQEPSNEKVQSNDTECLIGLSDGNMDNAEKFVQPSEIRALNIRTKHCIICYYYTMHDDTWALCVACMIWLRNIGVKEMYLVRKHKDYSSHTRQHVVVLGMRRADEHCIPVQYVPTPQWLKNY